MMEGDERGQVDPVVMDHRIEERERGAIAHIGEAQRNLPTGDVGTGARLLKQNPLRTAERTIGPLFAKASTDLEEQIEVFDRGIERGQSMPTEPLGEERKIEGPPVVGDQQGHAFEIAKCSLEGATLLRRVERDVLTEAESPPLGAESSRDRDQLVCTESGRLEIEIEHFLPERDRSGEARGEVVGIGGRGVDPLVDGDTCGIGGSRWGGREPARIGGSHSIGG